MRRNKMNKQKLIEWIEENEKIICECHDCEKKWTVFIGFEEMED